MDLFKAKRHEIDMRTLERFRSNPSAFLSAIDDEIARIKKFAFQANSGKVKISTIHSFKGWESPSVIVILESDFALPNTTFRPMSPQTIYTAITRARENMYIINIGNDTYHNFFYNQAL